MKRNHSIRRWSLAVGAVALSCAAATGAAHPADPFGPHHGGPQGPPSGPAAGPPSGPAANAPGMPGQQQVEYWEEAEEELLSLVNDARTASGCDILTEDGELTQAARDNSAEQAGQGSTGRAGSELGGPGGTAPGVDGHEGRTAHFSASGPEDAQAAMDSWDGLHGSNGSLVDCGFTTVGVGVVEDDDGPHWTVVLGEDG